MMIDNTNVRKIGADKKGVEVFITSLNNRLDNDQFIFINYMGVNTHKIKIIAGEHHGRAFIETVEINGKEFQL